LNVEKPVKKESVKFDLGPEDKFMNIVQLMKKKSFNIKRLKPMVQVMRKNL